VTSFFLAKFCEGQFGRPCEVGFPIKNELTREIPNKGYGNMAAIAHIMKNMLDEGTPIDVIISPDTDIFTVRRGVYFQLKRFGKGLADGTDPLIEYLNSTIKKKYAPAPNVTLMLLMECTEMDTVRLRQEFIPAEFPFQRLMFIALAKDKKFQIGEFWPNVGINEYDLSAYL